MKYTSIIVSDIDTKPTDYELENIIDTIKPQSFTSIFTEDSINDLVEYILYTINDYIEENSHIISEPDFDDIIYEDICDIIYDLYENYLYPEYYLTYNDTVEDELNDIIDFSFDIFYICFIPERSIPNNITCVETTEILDIEITETTEITENNKENITKIITYLKSMPQPAQRTNEWYEYRHNLITASNAYKAFESNSLKNQLIYEKCQPIVKSDTQKQSQQVNINTTFHWGQKYEPVSVMLYEYLYNTKIGDFGCIKHDKYHFLGASPDGINIDPNNEKYGTMLEIKNIVNREITGIPKKEYWVQTQLQMETCGLDECDFLETRFIEYENEELFLEDTIVSNTEQPKDIVDIEITAKNEYKGVIMYFANKDGNPYYVYKPMNIKTYTDFQKWEEEKMNEYNNEYTWIKNLYWRLDCLSCVLIKRNKKWFNENIHFLEEIWKTIEYERIHGYEHRAPSKKSKKEYDKNKTDNINDSSKTNYKCLLQIDTYTGDVTIAQSINQETINQETINQETINQETINLISNDTLPTTTTNSNILQFFKIRTQSFDEIKNENNI